MILLLQVSSVCARFSSHVEFHLPIAQLDSGQAVRFGLVHSSCGGQRPSSVGIHCVGVYELL